MEFHCPHCKIKLETDDGASGHEAACPACHGVMVVPAGAPIKEPAAQIPPAPISAPTAPRKARVPSADYKAHSGGGGFFKFVLLIILLALLAFGFACYQSNQPPQVVYQRLVNAVIQQISPPAPPPTPLQKPAAPPVVVVVQPNPLAPPPPTNVVVAPPRPRSPTRSLGFKSRRKSRPSRSPCWPTRRSPLYTTANLPVRAICQRQAPSGWSRSIQKEGK